MRTMTSPFARATRRITSSCQTVFSSFWGNLTVDTEHLRTFLEISRTRHFGQAARNLFLSQSAVSARIHTLEEQLKTPLFHRARNDIHLTPAGERLLVHAENILEAWNQARLDIAIEEQEQTPLRIGASTAVWDIYLKWQLGELRAKHHTSLIYAEVLEHEMIIRRLSEGSLDLGLSLTPAHVSRIESSAIYSTSLVLVSNEEKLSYEQALSSTHFIDCNWGSTAMSPRPISPQQPLTLMPAGDIPLQYLLDQGGAAYLAKTQVETYITHKQLFIVEDAPTLDCVIYGHSHHAAKQPNSLDGMVRQHITG